MIGPNELKRITNRDEEIIKLLYYNRYLSTSQITEIFFKYSIKNKGMINKQAALMARKRLRFLRGTGLIEGYERSDNKDMYYKVTEKGVAFLASILNIPFENFYYIRKENHISIGASRHCIMLGDVYIALKKAAKEKNGEIDTFRVERLNEVKFNVRDKTFGIIPDIFMIYRPDKNKSTVKLFYIEVDNSTERPKVFGKKINRYELYYRSNQFQDLYNGMFPKIITLCNTTRRIEALKKVTDTTLNWEYVLFDNVSKIID